jgi:hypothetical protein
MQAKTWGQAVGRSKFLEAVKAVNSEVLETLRDKVLPKFKTAVGYQVEPGFEIDFNRRLDMDLERNDSPKQILGVVALHQVKRIDLLTGRVLRRCEKFGGQPDEADAILNHDSIGNVLASIPGVTLEGSMMTIDHPDPLGMLAIIQAMVEVILADRETGDWERSMGCRVVARLQNYFLARSNEERASLLKYRTDILVALGTTEMNTSVGEGDDVPISIRPHPGPNWSEIESSQDAMLVNAKATILEWAERCHLTDAWILETVVQTLLSWMLNLRYEEALRWAHAGYLLPILRDPPRLHLEPLPFESPKMFDQRSRKELKAFRSTTKKYFSDIGFQKERFHKNAFQWLAQYQTRLDSPRMIAIEFERETGEHRTPSAIILAYQAAAEEIGLTLRQTLRGPKRQKRS